MISFNIQYESIHGKTFIMFSLNIVKNITDISLVIPWALLLVVHLVPVDVEHILLFGKKCLVKTDVAEHHRNILF